MVSERSIRIILCEVNSYFESIKCLCKTFLWIILLSCLRKKAKYTPYTTYLYLLFQKKVVPLQIKLMSLLKMNSEFNYGKAI